jgi:predicted DNA-binding transcriptional regulator YafY
VTIKTFNHFIQGPMDSSLKDLFRRNEILALVLNGTVGSKGDFADRFNVAGITISRDMLWLRNNGIQIWSKKNKIVVLEKPKTEALLNLSSNYLPLKLKSDLFHKAIKIFLRSKHDKAYEYLVLLSKAVLDKTIIRMQYKRFYDNELGHYEIKPVELIEKNRNWILAGIKTGESEIKMFYLSRIMKLELTSKRFSKLDVKQDITIKEKIVLRFSSNVADQITDKIWFDEFKLEKEIDGDFVLTTSHEINNSFAAWCVSWWDTIEIVEPQRLKHFISEMIDSFNSKNK